MPDHITPELFKHVRHAVERVCHGSFENDKLILTEADLEFRVCAELLNSNIQAIDDSAVHIHAQTNFLKTNDKLGWKPDIVLIPSAQYTVSEDGDLTHRKGYTHWGSAIALELKVLRKNHNTPTILKSVVGDLEKLSQIRDTHYGAVDPVHNFLSAAVVLCRKALPDSHVQVIQDTGRELDIPVWLFNK
ncbi:hypothetical protein JIN77_02210 [Verrucomicrobiaceae bacterium R5-34]|nr:hypothetical protein [Verrucomicrobiaceae bacterium R5-34]